RHAAGGFTGWLRVRRFGRRAGEGGGRAAGVTPAHTLSVGEIHSRAKPSAYAISQKNQTGFPVSRAPSRRTGNRNTRSGNGTRGRKGPCGDGVSITQSG